MSEGVIREGRALKGSRQLQKARKGNVQPQSAFGSRISRSPPSERERERKMANVVTSFVLVFVLVASSGQARSISRRQLDSLGGNQLLGRAVEDLEPQDFKDSYIQEKDFARSLDTLGGSSILRSRSLDTLGGGSILRSRSFDTLGDDNILSSRSLDTLGGGSLLRSRSLDTLGGGSILRSRSLGSRKGYYPPLDTLGGGSIL